MYLPNNTNQGLIIINENCNIKLFNHIQIGLFPPMTFTSVHHLGPTIIRVGILIEVTSHAPYIDSQKIDKSIYPIKKYLCLW